MYIHNIYMEEQITRKVTSIGNGAHIFLPRGWINEIVYVTKPKISLKEKIISILNPYLENIEGAYLYGSRARNEHDSKSDIDLLIISSKKIKLKQEGMDIIALDKKNFKKSISLNPILIYSILNEGVSIINSELLEDLKKEFKPKISDFKEFIDSTSSIIDINKDLINQEEDLIDDKGTYSYSIILRLKGIFIINSLLNRKKYSNKEFIHWIKKNCPNIELDLVYESYRQFKIKNSSNIKIKKSDLIDLQNFLNEQTKKLK